MGATLNLTWARLPVGELPTIRRTLHARVATASLQQLRDALAEVLARREPGDDVDDLDPDELTLELVRKDLGDTVDRLFADDIPRDTTIGEIEGHPYLFAGGTCHGSSDEFPSMDDLTLLAAADIFVEPPLTDFSRFVDGQFTIVEE